MVEMERPFTIKARQWPRRFFISAGLSNHTSHGRRECQHRIGMVRARDQWNRRRMADSVSYRPNLIYPKDGRPPRPANFLERSAYYCAICLWEQKKIWCAYLKHGVQTKTNLISKVKYWYFPFRIAPLKFWSHYVKKIIVSNKTRVEHIMTNKCIYNKLCQITI